MNDALEHRAALHLLSLLERERSHNLVAVGPALPRPIRTPVGRVAWFERHYNEIA